MHNNKLENILPICGILLWYLPELIPIYTYQIWVSGLKLVGYLPTYHTCLALALPYLYVWYLLSSYILYTTEISGTASGNYICTSKTTTCTRIKTAWAIWPIKKTELSDLLIPPDLSKVSPWTDTWDFSLLEETDLDQLILDLCFLFRGSIYLG